MLSFSTEFPVKETTPSAFVQAVVRWVSGSPHTSLTADQFSDLPTEGRWKIASSNTSLEAVIVEDDTTSTVAFRHVVTDTDLQWITEVTYSKSEADDWVGIRTSRESTRPVLSLPPAKKPLLVRTIIGELGGGLDDELHVSDKPHYLSDQNANMAVRLINDDAENYLPIVYVSHPFGHKHEVNAAPLAQMLGGLAHVVVEPSRAFSMRIQEDVASRNVYGGSVGVYWPNGGRHRYFLHDRTPTEFDVRRAIVSDIRAALLNRRPLARCTWSRAEAQLARSVFDDLQSSGSDNIDDYVAAFDAEINAKDKQLEDAEREIAQLQAQLRSNNYKSVEERQGITIKGEQEFRQNEFDEILKDALFVAVENAQDGSRRQHVLAAAAKHFTTSSSLQDARSTIKSLLKNYTHMNSDVMSGLEQLGFQVSEEGKHFKLVYMQDDRYVFSLPKSGSDWRGGKNAVSDIAKRVF